MAKSTFLTAFVLTTGAVGNNQTHDLVTMIQQSSRMSQSAVASVDASGAASAYAGWMLVLQYGGSAYEPRAEAYGVVNEATAGFAKLSDNDINSIDDGDSSYDYYMFTSDAQVGGSSDHAKLFIRVPDGSFQDAAPAMGWYQSSLEYCNNQDATTFADCTSWRSGGSRFDTQLVGGYVYDCRRWFMDYFGAIQCYTPRDNTKRCLSGNGGCGSQYGHYAIRENMKMYKKCSSCSASASGDPHATNLKNEQFEIHAVGYLNMITVPRGSDAEGAELAIYATTKANGWSSCAPSFISQVTISTEYGCENITVSPGQSVPDAQTKMNMSRSCIKPLITSQENTTELIIPRPHSSKDNVQVRISQRFITSVDGVKPFAYLDLEVVGFKDTTDVGGILGFDAHDAEATPSSECSGTNLLSSDKSLRRGSRAVAS